MNTVVFSKKHLGMSQVLFVCPTLPKDLPNSNQKLLEKILRISDKSLFRDDISIEKAQNIALWTIRGFSDSLLRYGSNIEDYQNKL